MNRTRSVAFLLASLLVAGCSSEQNADAERSPYVGQESREIKALSAQEINGYLKGRGMGFSKVAELNHYPGPKHVLDLSEKLSLTEEQRQEVKTSFQHMKNQARRLGRRLVEKEQQLDGLFTSENASKSEVEALLQAIGKLRSGFRFAHVQAHMEVKEVLTPAQVKQYDALRGYDEAGTGRKQHDHHNHGV